MYSLGLGAIVFAAFAIGGNPADGARAFALFVIVAAVFWFVQAVPGDRRARLHRRHRRFAQTQPRGVGSRGMEQRVTLSHNVRPPEDVNAVIEEARRAGADIVREPAETFWGG
ncbi:MAG TPA: hypothetical protein VF072_08815 [Thermoleophilaceae bacterium]